MPQDLTDTGLPEVLRGLAGGGATGALHLRGTAGTGEIFLRDGDVHSASSPAPRARLGARLVGAGFLTDEELDEALAVQERGPTRAKLGALLVERGTVRRDVIRVFAQEQILDAVFDLARWDDGEGEFLRGDAVPGELPVQIGVEPLLLEVDRRLAEWRDLRSVIPTLDAVPGPAPGSSSAQAALEPDELTILTGVDGRRSVRELAEDLGYGQFDAARLVYGLSLLGVLTVGEARDGERTRGGPPGRGQPPADEVDEIDVGRALEEALFGAFGEDAEPAAGSDAGPQPQERVPGPDPEERAPRPEPAVGTPGGGADDLEPEVWTASIDGTDGAGEPAGAEDRAPPADGPPARARAIPDEEDAHAPADVPPATEPSPRDDRAAAEAREELLALMSELGDLGGPDEAPEPPRPAGRDEPPATERGDERHAPADRGTAPADPSDGRDQQRRVERGEVSELLRELSRLAGGDAEPDPSSPDGADDEPPRDDRGDERAGPPAGSSPRREEADTRGHRDRGTDRGDEDGEDADDRRSTFRRLFGGSR